MAARNRLPRPPPPDMRGFCDAPPPLLPLGFGPLPPHPIEEELALRFEEIQRIIADNRFLMEEISILRREIPIIKEEVHVLANQAIPRLNAEKELESRELIQRGLMLEGEMRSLEPINAEVLKLRTERQKLGASNDELSAKVQGMTQELKHLQSENQHLPAIRVEVDGLRDELVRTRMAYAYEKKASNDIKEQRQVMEKDLVAMSQEAEKLRAELEKRGRAPVSFYPFSYGY